jgi:hypothetical protein
MQFKAHYYEPCQYFSLISLIVLILYFKVGLLLVLAESKLLQHNCFKILNKMDQTLFLGGCSSYIELNNYRSTIP